MNPVHIVTKELAEQPVALKLPVALEARSHVLSNGMKIIVHEDHRLPIVALSLSYQVGSRNETSGRTGLAHFFEHMMFNGSKRFLPGEFDRLMEANGASNNAYTTKDVTVYQDWAPPSALGLIFELEADRMGYLSIDPVMVESERGVVANERRRYMAEPESVLDELLYSTAYTAHPYRWPVLGWMSDIECWQLEDLQLFFEQYYSPHNCKMIITGAVRADEVFALAEQTFGRLSRRTAGLPIHTVEPPQVGLRRAEVTMPSALGQLQMGWHIPASAHDDYWALSTLEKLLFHGQSSICYQSFVKTEMALNVGGGIDSQSFDPTLFTVRTNLRHGVSPTQFEDKLNQVIEQLINAPVPQADLNKASRQSSCDLLRALKTVSGKCELISAFELFGEGIEEIPIALEKYASVTAEAVQRVAATYLQSFNCSSIALKPATPKTIVQLESGLAESRRLARIDETSEVLKQSEHPTSAAHKRANSHLQWRQDDQLAKILIELPEFETVKLENGLTVQLLQRKDLPLICMALAFDSGGRKAPTGQEGLATIVARLLRKGTEKYDEPEIARIVDQSAGFLGVSIAKFPLTLFAEFVSEDQHKALDLLEQVARHPKFEAEKFEKVKRRSIDAIRNDRTAARSVIDRFFVGAILESHPWARPTSGDENSLESLTLEHVKQFHKAEFIPNNAEMVVVGDFDQDELLTEIRNRFGDWEQGQKVEEPTVAPPKLEQSKVLVVHKPDSDDVVFQIGRIGMARTHECYPEFTLLNTLLGGRFTSRLNTVLRIEEGLTYGIGSGCIDFQDFGLFRIDSFSARETIERAIDLTLKVTRVFHEYGIDETELESAKAYFRGQYPTDFETNEQLAEWLLFLRSRGLDRTHLTESMAKMEALTVERANQIIREHFAFEAVQFVLVGDKTDLQFASKYGPVTTVELDSATFTSQSSK